MNEFNSLEKRLRSWTPRPPSPRIRRRLFAKAVPLERRTHDPIAWRWLAPAMALCVAALIVLARNPHSGFGGTAAYRVTPTFALSNLDFATYFAAAAQNDRNLLYSTFEWTNGGHSTTTAPSYFDRTGYRE